MNNKALIDGDPFIYKGLYVNKDVSIDEKIRRTCHYLNGFYAQYSKVYIFFSTRNNFRKFVYPDYKGNRESIEKPEGFYKMKLSLIKAFSSFYKFPYEADDLIASAAFSLGEINESYTVISNDKDLLQIPGYHYDFKKKSEYYIGEEEANKFVWFQLLTGDVIDNISGIRGIGKVKATKILEEENYKELITNLYKKNYRNWKYEMKKRLFLLTLKKDIFIS